VIVSPDYLLKDIKEKEIPRESLGIIEFYVFFHE
jgi:hypothetical protein